MTGLLQTPGGRGGRARCPAGGDCRTADSELSANSRQADE